MRSRLPAALAVLTLSLGLLPALASPAAAAQCAKPRTLGMPCLTATAPASPEPQVFTSDPALTEGDRPSTGPIASPATRPSKVAGPACARHRWIRARACR